MADHYLFHLQDPGNKFAPSDGSLCDFIDKYVEGVERTMAEIVRLGNIRREEMPGQLANAGYFHLFQQVLFYYPDGKRKLHEWMEKEFRLWCEVTQPECRARANCVPIQTSRKPPHSSGRFSSDYHTRCLLTKDSTSEFFTSVSFIYMSC